MKNWNAVTNSGTRYEYRDGHVNVIPAEGTPYTINPWKIQINAVPITACDLPWKNPEDWDDVLYPIVGRHLYVQGRSDYRISTPIVSVEDAD